MSEEFSLDVEPQTAIYTIMLGGYDEWIKECMANARDVNQGNLLEAYKAGFKAGAELLHRALLESIERLR